MNTNLLLRFTIAKSLDDLTSNKLSELMNSIIRDRNTGCFIIGPKKINSKIDDNFLVKLSTAIAHLIGIPNHDSMAEKYYARFFVKHKDDSDSYLRKAYTNMDLHTDGTYVKEKTDWLLMTKIEEKNAEGGETTMLHLDDWEHCEDLFNDPVGKQNFIGDLQKAKMLTTMLNTQFSQRIKKEELKYLILINFQNQKVWIKVIFYKDYPMDLRKVKIR